MVISGENQTVLVHGLIFGENQTEVLVHGLISDENQTVLVHGLISGENQTDALVHSLCLISGENHMPDLSAGFRIMLASNDRSH